MALVKFWEKPGCKGNNKQKEILLASGHELEVHSLLTEAWSAATLRLFFADLPLPQWFNPTNPQIKSGEIVPEDLNAQQALDLMVAEPLLIVRPLMQVGEQRMAGFEVACVDSWIGLKRGSVGERDPKNCPCVAQVCDPA